MVLILCIGIDAEVTVLLYNLPTSMNIVSIVVLMSFSVDTPNQFASNDMLVFHMSLCLSTNWA